MEHDVSGCDANTNRPSVKGARVAQEADALSMEETRCFSTTLLIRVRKTRSSPKVELTQDLILLLVM